MTERKFSPPTTFPAEYVDGHGGKVIIVGRGEGRYPLVGQMRHDSDVYVPVSFTEGGSYHITIDNMQDLHDTNKRITTWHNVYDNWFSSTYFNRSHADEHYDACKEFIPRPRLCVYRIERDEDGGNPEIFVEKV